MPHFITSILSLLFVLGLIVACAALFRKFYSKNIIGNTTKQKIISIEEIKIIDQNHKLVLVKMNNKMHLLLLSKNSQILIESISL